MTQEQEVPMTLKEAIITVGAMILLVVFAIILGGILLNIPWNLKDKACQDIGFVKAASSNTCEDSYGNQYYVKFEYPTITTVTAKQITIGGVRVAEN